MKLLLESRRCSARLESEWKSTEVKEKRKVSDVGQVTQSAMMHFSFLRDVVP